MRNNRIRLKESQPHNVIRESVKRVLNERLEYKNEKEAFYAFQDATDKMLEVLEKERYVGEGCDEGNELFDKLVETLSDLRCFFSHPDFGGPYMVWSALPYQL